MNILSIESSTDVCGVSVMDAKNIYYHNEMTQSRIHSEKLPQFVQNAILKSKISISAIAVSIGPGSYTGLRIGISMAKGLAFAMGLPVIPVPTLISMNARIPSADLPRYVFVHSYGDWIFIQKFSGENQDELPQSIRIKDFIPEPGIDRIYGYGARFPEDRNYKVQQVCPSSRWVGITAIQNYETWIEKDINNVSPLYITNFNLTL